MADPQHLERLRAGVETWNRWRKQNPHAWVDLSGADLDSVDLNGAHLNGAELGGANLSGAHLERAQLGRAHMTGADLNDAVLERANLLHAVARKATFDDVHAAGANFAVSTLRRACFRGADLTGARFHRAYLRDADLTGADLTGANLRFAVLEDATCRGTIFRSADLSYASLVGCHLEMAQLIGVQVYGTSAWDLTTDDATAQDLIVSVDTGDGESPLRTSDLHTAQLLALMLEGSGVRQVLNSVTSKLVLVLGSFAPTEKSVLDVLRDALQGCGYVAVTFDFERPEARDYAETIVVLGGLSRFVVADFTNAKEVRSEVRQIREQYRSVPVIPILMAGATPPVTMAGVFREDLRLLVRYRDADDLVGRLQRDVVQPAEARAEELATSLAAAQEKLRNA